VRQSEAFPAERLCHFSKFEFQLKMAVSVFDMFKVGIGPSSSHTVGPMRAGHAFVKVLRDRGMLEQATSLKIELMGSLAATGKGHGTDTAAQLGLLGRIPETMDPDEVSVLIGDIRASRQLKLDGMHAVAFDPEADIAFHADKVPAFHTNAMEFSVFAGDSLLYRRRYYSVGGGFIVAAREDDPEQPVTPKSFQGVKTKPYPYRTGDELMKIARDNNLTIAELVYRNECVDRTPEEVDRRLDEVWQVMHAAVERGMRQTEVLPGPFRIARRANALMQDVRQRTDDPLAVLDWVNVYAMAVAEENAAGGRVVTAPTNGAAGVIPAVIEYYLRHVSGSTMEGVRTFLLTAGAVGMLYKENASISGAEVGCQGEVGVACSMAAAGLAAVCGGTVEQIENAAEIGMEHNLGLTCDPVAGQVQIPCIERNAIAAVKAINAARMALRGNGSHYISLDQVIRTMMATGRDMQSKYKETSLGGLAVSIVEC
jgi:L-serine ammonia-lyase